MQPIDLAYKNGWRELLPIKPGTKRPVIDGWPDFDMTPERLQMALTSGIDTFGLKARNTPGLDIDVPNDGFVTMIQQLAFDELGTTLVRIGDAPKCLLPYRTATPFSKRKLTMSSVGTDPHKWAVEFLGDGQQYVLMGKHPTAGEYEWRDKQSPMIVPRHEIPEITAEDADRFLEALAAKMNPYHWETKLTGAGRDFVELSPVDQAKTQAVVATIPPAPDLLAPSIHDVQALVKRTPNPASLGWDEFMKFGLAIKGASGGSDAGLKIFQGWANNWQAGDSNTLLQKKIWIGTATTGWRTLLQRAREYGADTAAFEFDVVEVDVVESVVTSGEFSFDDVASADNIVNWIADHEAQPTALYSAAENRWYAYRRGCWTRAVGNSKGAAMSAWFIRPILTRMADWLFNQPLKPNEKPAGRLKRITQVRSTPFYEQVRRAMEHFEIPGAPWIVSGIDAFDTPELTDHLLNTPSGTFDFTSGLMRAHDPRDMITKCTKVSATATPTPLWNEMLALVIEDDDQIEYLRRYLGAALMRSKENKALLVLHGPTGGGKSSIVQTIMGAVLGADYTASTSEGFVVRKPGRQPEKHPTELEAVVKARFVVAPEAGESMIWNEELLKRLTGGDSISARKMYQDATSDYFGGRMVVTANTLPKTGVVDDALRGRFRFMRLERIPDEKRRNIRLQIEAEAPGILWWLLDGCLSHLDHNVADAEHTPVAVLANTKDLLDASDPFAQFIDVVVIPCDPAEIKNADRMTSTDLYDAYKDFCLATGMPQGLDNANAFAQALSSQNMMTGLRKKVGNRHMYAVRINVNVMQTVHDKAAIADLMG